MLAEGCFYLRPFPGQVCHVPLSSTCHQQCPTRTSPYNSASLNAATKSEATRDMRQSSAGLVADPLCSASLPHPHLLRAAAALQPVAHNSSNTAPQLRAPSTCRIAPYAFLKSACIIAGVSSTSSPARCRLRLSTRWVWLKHLAVWLKVACRSQQFQLTLIVLKGAWSRPFKGAPRANPQVILKCSCHVFHNHRPHTHWSMVSCTLALAIIAIILAKMQSWMTAQRIISRGR